MTTPSRVASTVKPAEVVAKLQQAASYAAVQAMCAGMTVEELCNREVQRNLNDEVGTDDVKRAQLLIVLAREVGIPMELIIKPIKAADKVEALTLHLAKCQLKEMRPAFIAPHHQKPSRSQASPPMALKNSLALTFRAPHKVAVGG